MAFAAKSSYFPRKNAAAHMRSLSAARAFHRRLRGVFVCSDPKIFLKKRLYKTTAFHYNSTCGSGL